ncbi:hypothetical protein DF188_08185 [Aliarcobacter skirrowii]|uniref:Uncharacterized protein n=1 Tax=Aliarcobacter skirrowii TaxID=28200 RepID=A0A2U2BZJ1_9BACT|nr:hypothetical protein [Aliarcobacter skirrowii]MDX4038575.1 hypothetical protein [Aliarcobacter skirrowii]PWE20438.1 hypothetical protein DF188_08185 [Aliarcobacter skirrowii]
MKMVTLKKGIVAKTWDYATKGGEKDSLFQEPSSKISDTTSSKSVDVSNNSNDKSTQSSPTDKSDDKSHNNFLYNLFIFFNFRI